jgi:hypothetical protein
MLINHDLRAAHQIHLIIEDANHVQHSFAGPVTLVQYSNTPSENRNTTVPPSPDSMYNLPTGSITVIRGKLH